MSIAEWLPRLAIAIAITGPGIPAKAQTWVTVYEQKLPSGSDLESMDWRLDAKSLVRRDKYAYINLDIQIFDRSGKRVKQRVTERGPIVGVQVDCETRKVSVGGSGWVGAEAGAMHAVVEFACR